MFSIVDILTISIIVILFFFLFILFQLEKILTKPRVYLKSVLIIVIFISISEELIFLKQHFPVSLYYPFVITGYFLIYPLVYLYSSKLVFANNVGNITKLRSVLYFPLVILLIVSSLYYPLDYNSKLEFIKLHIWGTSSDFKLHTVFIYVITFGYYLQVIFYLGATFRLISGIKKKINKESPDLLIINYIRLFVISAVAIEVLVIFNQIIFSNNMIVQLTVEQFLSMILVSICFYIGIKQSLIIMQSRMVSYSDKLIDIDEIESIHLQKKNTENGLRDAGIINVEAGKNIKNRLSDKEKNEIKEAIENYFSETKIYLDPNLKIEILAKKIHITARRISTVINEVFEVNFNHFINDYRIADAVRHISQNDSKITVEEVYTKVGFNSRSAFNSAFKKSTGYSPADFRKSIN